MKSMKIFVWIVVALAVVGGVYYATAGSHGTEVTGTVNYLEKTALPKGSVIEVRLFDISNAEVPAVEISSQTIKTSGENVPVPFKLSYSQSKIAADGKYSVAARILVDGSVAWVSNQNYPVITDGYPTFGVQVYVASTR